MPDLDQVDPVRLESLADTLEEWGAGNADMSAKEGDACDERYKAFQMSAELIRAALTAGDPQPEAADLERVARLAFMAGAEFFKDEIRRTRNGGLSTPSTPMLVKAADDYAKEAK